MTPTFKLAAAGLTLAALIGAAGCQRPAEPSGETASPSDAAPAAASADVYPFTVGALRLAALRDGELVVPIAESPWVEAGSPAAEVSGLLTAAGAPADAVHLSVQPLLVRDGDRVVLLDAGAGGQMGTANTLVASLRAAGVEPEQVTDVLISHAHGDHVGGLVNAQGALTFPKAVIRMSAPEWTAARAGAEKAGAGPLVAAIAPKVETFQPGAQATPSIRAVALDGHMPGHTGYEIVSGNERLLYFGDALHSSIISVQRPDLANVWDKDRAAAAATRRDLLNRGATEGLRYYGVHFPFPGLGRVERKGEAYVWVPEVAAPR
ncbi:MBL fold metallo-hydrolase [Brevundimonas faecalis]|uniref:MBL fold metallo-hydrolase n=1 Tax=Brevundimonas faecalis TaxID=947378 RepID=UPI00360EA70B